MNDHTQIICPHCGQEFGVALDVREGRADYVVDCEVCCRPVSVAVEVREGEVESIEVSVE